MTLLNLKELFKADEKAKVTKKICNRVTPENDFVTAQSIENKSENACGYKVTKLQNKNSYFKIDKKDWQEWFDERAGILEFDGGLKRMEAEAEAFNEIVYKYFDIYKTENLNKAVEFLTACGIKNPYHRQNGFKA